MKYAWAVPGAKVRCVKVEDFCALHGEIVPTVGQTYTIRSVVEVNCKVGLRLVEITNPAQSYTDGYSECAFVVSWFRPVIDRTQEQDVAIFAPLLTQKSIHVSEPEVVS